ncbi:ABC transporter substrate-binding protein [Frankia sp. EI5c]|uniref:ABC transporter substrate-binding protein n=1 Tax=Frankia sp. EI5c TaxID=683316 RepID=UPI0012FF85FD|nr:ABC transporter substrate-binding protein [Frankia sp. EI5c]
MALTMGAFMFTACGSDDSSDSAAAAGLTGTPVKIGMAVPLTGDTADTAKASVGVAKAWASWVNEQGGLGGHPVEILSADSKASGQVMLAAMKRFVEDENVSAVMIADTSAEGAVGEYLAGKNVPVVGAQGFDTTLWSKLPNFYSLTTTFPTTLAGQVAVAAELGAKKFGVIVCAEVPACREAEKVFQPLVEKQSLEYTGLATVASADANFTAACLSQIQQGADFISINVKPAIAVRVMADCRQQGYKGYFGRNSSGFSQASDETVADTRSGVNLNAFPWWADAPAAKNFRDIMAKYDDDVDYRDSGSTATWTALELFRKALGAPAGDVTRQSVTDAYSKISDETLDGLLPMPITFTAGQAAAKVPCFWLASYSAGADNPELLPVKTAGNGASGDLASTCLTA